MTAVSLRLPSGVDREPEPDPCQISVLAYAAENPGRHLLVTGLPGSGKTTLAVALAADAVHGRGFSADSILVLTPTRRAAERLRDRVSVALGTPTGGAVVRSVASLAWSILRERALEAGEPPPVLVTGAMQDEIFRDLLAGYRAGRAPGPAWEGVAVPEATVVPRFRHELRDLVMRAEEADLGPEDLRRLGERYGRPEWRAAAHVFEEYEAILGLRRTVKGQGALYDQVGLVAAAADVLSGRDHPPLSLVILDDAQDVTRAAWRLLKTLARSAQVILVGNADQAVQGFRGAAPEVLAGAVLDEPAGLGAAVLRLTRTHRQSPGLAAVSARIAERIGTSREFSARKPWGDDLPDPPIEVIVSPAMGEATALAACLRDAHRGGTGELVPWSGMAVIARTGARARELRTGLIAEGIPCVGIGGAIALHLEPAVAPLLRLARAALGEEWTAEQVERVLSSRLVGLGAMSIRRLRRHMVKEEREGGGTRPARVLLVDAMEDPSRMATISGSEARRVAVVARAIGAGRSQVDKGGSASEVLWAIWDTLGVAEDWRQAALRGSEVDDADLDAVVALFDAASRHSERLPDAPPASFLAYLEGQGFADDSLAARGAVAEAVAIETAASASGREWDVVAIAGLEEGTWPDLRLRDTVFGAVGLAEALSGRKVNTSGRDPSDAAHLSRLDVLADETRAFYVAFTRARRKVIALCREEGEHRPSRFVSLVDGPGHSRRRTVGDIHGLSSLRDAVIRLRREAEPRSRDERAGHVAMLARLAGAGVPGADPADWHGVARPSTDEPLWRADEVVRVSPSKVEGIESCPLRAMLESAGGSGRTGEAQRRGILVHSIAAEHPTATAGELKDALAERWSELGFPDNWVGVRERGKIDRMMERLADYAAGVREDGWEVKTERRFRVEVGQALLSGQADRVHVRDGMIRIADLKTASSAIGKAEAQGNAQLAMYQVAVTGGGFPEATRAAGAELVFLGMDGGNPVRGQDPIDREEAEARLRGVVSELGKAAFEARVGADCRVCPVKRSCPAWPQGGQVSGP